MEYYCYNGGRLGNQLYYILQIFILRKLGYNCIYCMDSKAKKNNCDKQLIALNCEDFFCTNYQNENIIRINDYCQFHPKWYQLSDIYNFIQLVILNSAALQKYFTANQKNQNSCAIHIRNGDYIGKIESFNRVQYITNACLLLKKQNSHITNINVVSDDVVLCEQLYDNLFHRFFKNVNYFSKNTSVINDFLFLSTNRNLILFNSTFSYWAAHISNVIYGNYSFCIIPKYFNGFRKTRMDEFYCRVNKIWNMVNVK